MSDALVVANGVAKEETPSRLVGSSDIQIKIKRNKHEIEIDMDRLTWKDGKQLRKYQQSIEDGSLTEEEAIGLLDDIIEKVTGKHPDNMPMEVVNKIVEVLFANDADAVAAEGNS